MTQRDPVRANLQWLGLKVREKVTGFAGTVTSVSFDLYGCTHGLVTPPRNSDGKQEDSCWYDLKRLEDVGEGQRVLEPPADWAPEYVAGPEAKPIP